MITIVVFEDVLVVEASSSLGFASPRSNRVRRRDVIHAPLHVALRGHMGTGKDHDLEQFAAMLRLPYYRIPLTGEVRDITLIGSTKLHGDGKGGTESRWEDGDITRALRGPALINMSELNAAGRRDAVCPPRPPGPLPGARPPHRRDGPPARRHPHLRDDEPDRSADYAGTQTLNKAFADRWVIWEKRFPEVEQIEQMLRMTLPGPEGTVRHHHRPPRHRGERVVHLRRCQDQGRDPDEPARGARSPAGRTLDVRRPRGPAAQVVGVAGAEPHRPVRSRSLRDGVERGGAAGRPFAQAAGPPAGPPPASPGSEWLALAYGWLIVIGILALMAMAPSR